MPGQILAGLAGAILPGLGAQAAAQQQRRWALQDLEAQNIYNSPKEQLLRLKRAGLPAAAFFSGGASSQSEQPRSINTDPTMGVAQGISNFFQNRIQSAQIKGLEAEARTKVAGADIAEADRDWWLRGTRNAETGDITNARGTMLNTEQLKRQAEAATAQFIRDIKASDSSVAQQLNDANLLNLIRRNKILNQQFTSEDERLKFVKRLQAAATKGDQSGTGNDIGFGTIFDLIYLMLSK